MLVNKTKLAEIIGVSHKTLTEWQNDGMPFVKGPSTNAGNEYDTVVCIEWRINKLMSKDNYDLTVERARLAKEQADAKEMDNAVTRGELVAASEVVAQWRGEFARAKSKLLSMPSKLAPLMVGVKTPAEAQSILETVVWEALNELSQPD